MQEIRPGLYRWSARHPAWSPNAAPESPGDWPPEVGCVAWAAPDALVLVDPLVEDWAALGALVERHGPRVHAVTTLEFHRRSRVSVVERYGATTSAALPAGVELKPIPGADETMLWLAEPRALVAGDRLIGDGRGGVRMCPQSWLGYLRDFGVAELRAGLAPLLALPIELVLVSHGEPVLANGRAALARALAP